MKRCSRPPRPVNISTRFNTFDAFRHRNYRFLWCGTALFSAGFWLQQVVVGWLAYEITGSPLMTSIALGLDALPILFGAPLGGLLSDKYDKKLLLAMVFVYQALILLGYSIITMAGYAATWNLFFFVFLLGISWVISDPARMSLLAVIIPRESLINAFSLNSMAFSVMRLLVPAAAGFSLALVGPSPLFMVEAVLMLSAALIVMMMRFGDDASAAQRHEATGKIMLDLKSGLDYVIGEKTIIGLACMTVITVILIMPFSNGLMPVYAAEVFHVGPEGLGMLLSSAGLGSLIGTVALASFARIERPGKTLFILLGGLGILMAMLGINHTYTGALLLMMLLSGFMMTYFSISGATVQGILPDKYRGRVTGIYMMAWGLMPVGSLISGTIANIVGVQLSSLTGSSLIFLCLIIATYYFKGVWNYRIKNNRDG